MLPSQPRLVCATGLASVPARGLRERQVRRGLCAAPRSRQARKKRLMETGERQRTVPPHRPACEGGQSDVLGLQKRGGGRGEQKPLPQERVAGSHGLHSASCRFTLRLPSGRGELTAAESIKPTPVHSFKNNISLQRLKLWQDKLWPPGYIF